MLTRDWHSLAAETQKKGRAKVVLVCALTALLRCPKSLTRTRLAHCIVCHSVSKVLDQYQYWY